MSKINPFSWKIYDFLTKQGCLEKGCSYLIAVSGGSDSVALARVFFDIQKKQKIKVVLVYFHHSLRERSNEEKLFVENLSKKWGFGYRCFQNTKLQKPGIQNKARNWRYQELKRLKEQEHYDFVLLGHHLDDLAETQVWRLLRGVSLFDLEGLLPVQGYFVRPLLYTSKEEIKNYLQELGQTWMEDESNLMQNYTRNYIRHQIIPKMKGAFFLSGKTKESFLQKMLALHLESISLNKVYLEQVSSIKKTDNLQYEQLQSLPELFSKKVIHDFFLTCGIKELLRSQINNAYQLIMQNKGNWQLKVGKGYTCYGEQKKLFCKKTTTCNVRNYNN